MVGSEELYGVGTSTPKRRSDQVKVEILRHHASGATGPSFFYLTHSRSLRFIMDDLYDEYVSFDSLNLEPC